MAIKCGENRLAENGTHRECPPRSSPAEKRAPAPPPVRPPPPRLAQLRKRPGHCVACLSAPGGASRCAAGRLRRPRVAGSSVWLCGRGTICAVLRTGLLLRQSSLRSVCRARLSRSSRRFDGSLRARFALCPQLAGFVRPPERRVERRPGLAVPAAAVRASFLGPVSRPWFPGVSLPQIPTFPVPRRPVVVVPSASRSRAAPSAPGPSTCRRRPACVPPPGCGFAAVPSSSRVAPSPSRRAAPSAPVSVPSRRLLVPHRRRRRSRNRRGLFAACSDLGCAALLAGKNRDPSRRAGTRECPVPPSERSGTTTPRHRTLRERDATTRPAPTPAPKAP